MVGAPVGRRRVFSYYYVAFYIVAIRIGRPARPSAVTQTLFGSPALHNPAAGNC